MSYEDIMSTSSKMQGENAAMPQHRHRCCARSKVLSATFCYSTRLFGHGRMKAVYETSARTTMLCAAHSIPTSMHFYGFHRSRMRPRRPMDRVKASCVGIKKKPFYCLSAANSTYSGDRKLLRCAMAPLTSWPIWSAGIAVAQPSEKGAVFTAQYVCPMGCCWGTRRVRTHTPSSVLYRCTGEMIGTICCYGVMRVSICLTS